MLFLCLFHFVVFFFFANKLYFLRDRQTNGLMLVGFCTFLVVSSYDDYSVLHYIVANIYIMRLVSYVIVYPSIVNLKYIIYLIIYLEINYIYDVISNLGGLVVFVSAHYCGYLSLSGFGVKTFRCRTIKHVFAICVKYYCIPLGLFFFPLLNITTVFI